MRLLRIASGRKGTLQRYRRSDNRKKGKGEEPGFLSVRSCGAQAKEGEVTEGNLGSPLFVWSQRGCGRRAAASAMNYAARRETWVSLCSFIPSAAAGDA